MTIRWTDDRIRAELDRFLAGASEWPSYADFARAGRKALRDHVTRAGGTERWARELGTGHVKRRPDMPRIGRRSAFAASSLPFSPGGRTGRRDARLKPQVASRCATPSAGPGALSGGRASSGSRTKARRTLPTAPCVDQRADSHRACRFLRPVSRRLRAYVRTRSHTSSSSASPHGFSRARARPATQLRLGANQPWPERDEPPRGAARSAMER
jgi:hypothetical protein